MRAQRSNLFPAVDATASETRQRFSAASLGSRGAGTFTQYAASVGVSYELDFFGKLRSADHAALERLLAQEETRRAVQLGLLGELARAYVALAADRELERLARETLDSQQESFRLRTHEHDLGAISGLTLDQARTTVEAARVDLERYAGAIAVDTNALTLLVGAPFAAELLPAGLDAGAAALAPLPAGLPSEVLLRRPDVMAAEHRLRAANADIGVARAAFFPTISLTASTGYASDSLASLFTAGNRLWNFVPRLTAPLFHGGRLRAELKLAEIERDAAVAQYELDPPDRLPRGRRRPGARREPGAPGRGPAGAGRHLRRGLRDRPEASRARPGQLSHRARRPALLLRGATIADRPPPRPASQPRDPLPGARRRLE